MKKVKLIALLLVAVMIFGVATACSKTSQDQTDDQPKQTDSSGGDVTQPDAPEDKPKEPITFTMFQADPGEPPPEDNKIIKRIREMTGVTVEIEYLVGDMEQKVGIMIAGGDYPDLIGPGQARGQFLNAGAFVALDDYLPKYPNLWRHYEPFIDTLRSVSSDGKIYIMDIWGRDYWLNDGEDTQYQVGYNGPAFWTQKTSLHGTIIQIRDSLMHTSICFCVTTRLIPRSTDSLRSDSKCIHRIGVRSAQECSAAPDRRT